MSYRIAVLESAPHTVLELHRMVRPEHAGDDIGAGMREMYALADRIGLAPAGPPSTTYHGDFSAGHRTEVDFGLPVSAGPIGGTAAAMTVRQTKSALFAATTHRGDYLHIDAAYRALDDWLGTSNFAQIGPATEVYLIGPEEAADPHDLLTEIRIPVAVADHLTTTVAAPLADAVALVREALAEQGFGVLTEIDVRATLAGALGIELTDYVILGACNPRLAHRALAVDPHIGLLLPCNVVVRAEGETTVVEAVDPLRLLADTDHPELRPIAEEASTRLAAAVQTVDKRTSAI